MPNIKENTKWMFDFIKSDFKLQITHFTFFLGHELTDILQ